MCVWGGGGWGGGGGAVQQKNPVLWCCGLNIYYGFSSEAPRRGASDEKP